MKVVCIKAFDNRGGGGRGNTVQFLSGRFLLSRISKIFKASIIASCHMTLGCVFDQFVGIFTNYFFLHLFLSLSITRHRKKTVNMSSNDVVPKL